MYKLILLNLVLASTAFACPGLRHGDLNCDEKIDINDFTILAENWLREYDMSYPDKVQVSGVEGVLSILNGILIEAGTTNDKPHYDRTHEEVFIGRVAWSQSANEWRMVNSTGLSSWRRTEEGDGPEGVYAPATGDAAGTATVTAYTEGIGPPVVTDITTDTDSLAVSLTGDTGATHTVLYRLSTATAWINGGTRTGDGNVVIDSLAAGTYYVQAYSTLDGVNSTPGNMVTSTILDNPTQGDDFVSETGITVTVDNDNLVVNITGQSGASHRVLYKTSTESVWKEGGVRKGDGQVTITSLPAATYHVQVKSVYIT